MLEEKKPKEKQGVLLERISELENSLKQSELRYSVLTKFSHEWEYWRNPDCSLVHISLACEKVSGYAPNDFTKMPGLLDKIVVDEDKEVWSKHVKEDEDEFMQEERSIEFRIKRKGGGIVWIRHTCHRIVDGEGIFMGYRARNQDITNRKETENALRVSEKKFRDLFEKSEDAILIVENGKFVDCNHAAVKMLRYKDKDSFLNIHPSALSPEKQEDGQLSSIKADEMMDIAIKKGSHRFIWRHLRSNGEVFPVEILLTRINVDDEHQVLHTIWRDITKRKKAEKYLEENEARFRAIFENSRDAISVSLKGIHVQVNPAYLEMFGYNHEAELIGRSILDCIAPSEHKKIMANVQSRSEGSRDAPVGYETRGQRKDGSGFDMDVRVSNYVLNGEQFTLVILRDISARKKAENSLRESEARYRQMFETNHAVKLIINPDDGRILEANKAACEFYGYDAQTCTSLYVTDINISPNEEIQQEMESARNGKRGFFNFSHKLSSGEIRDVEVYSGPVDNGDRTVLYSIIHDVTERKEAEIALRKNENLLSTIAANYPNSFLSIIETDFTVGFSSGQEFTRQNLDPKQFVGLTLNQVFGDKAVTVQKHYEKTFAGDERSFELFINNQYQHYRTVPLFAEDGSVPQILVVVENITVRKQAEIELENVNEQLALQLAEIKELESALREQVIRDPLTGLYNRRYMAEVLERELTRASRQESPLSIVILDLDNLKIINDQYGHVAGGDQALVALSNAIQSLCRTEDTFCRYAGDEFVVILYNTSPDIAYERAREWQKAVSNLKLMSGEKEFTISFSAGIAKATQGNMNSEDFIQNADRALYKAKEAGRNCIVVYK